VSLAIDEYAIDMADRGCKPRHIDTTKWRLGEMFDGDPLVRELDRRRAQKLYNDLRDKGHSVDTHRNTLNQTRTFCKWLVKRGYLATNPFADVEGVGKRKRGKVQLTIDESRKLVGACLASDSTGATATLCCLLLALRASEVANISLRALDDGGRILRVMESKTEAGIRLLEVPDVLRPRMAALAELDVDRHWVGYHVRLWCERAGVTVVGPHSLRGTHASLATGAGATSQLVAGSLGHASTSVTEAHYTKQEATAGATQRAALKVLEGGRL
jgi:integrase